MALNLEIFGANVVLHALNYIMPWPSLQTSLVKNKVNMQFLLLLFCCLPEKLQLSIKISTFWGFSNIFSKEVCLYKAGEMCFLPEYLIHADYICPEENNPDFIVKNCV